MTGEAVDAAMSEADVSKYLKQIIDGEISFTGTEDAIASKLKESVAELSKINQRLNTTRRRLKELETASINTDGRISALVGLLVDSESERRKGE